MTFEILKFTKMIEKCIKNDVSAEIFVQRQRLEIKSRKDPE